MSFHPSQSHSVRLAPDDLSSGTGIVADPWRYGLPASLRDKTAVDPRLNTWFSPGVWDAVTHEDRPQAISCSANER